MHTETLYTCKGERNKRQQDTKKQEIFHIKARHNNGQPQKYY